MKLAGVVVMVVVWWCCCCDTCMVCANNKLTDRLVSNIIKNWGGWGGGSLGMALQEAATKRRVDGRRVVAGLQSTVGDSILAEAHLRMLAVRDDFSILDGLLLHCLALQCCLVPTRRSLASPPRT